MNLLFLFVTILIHSKILLIPSQIAYGDFSPMPESLQQSLESFFFTWKEIGFGIYRNPGHTEPLLQSLFLLIFRTPERAQKAFIIVLPCIAFMSFKYFITAISEKKPNRFAVFISSFFYAYAPIFILEFIGGTLYSTMLGFAFFPVLYKKTMDMIDTGKKTDLIILSICLTGVLSFFPHMIIIYVFSLLIPFTLDLRKRGFARIIVWLQLGIVALIVFLANPLFILENFSLISQSNSAGLPTNFAKSSSSFFQDIDSTYHYQTLDMILRNEITFKPFSFYSQSIILLPLLIMVLLILGYNLYTSTYDKQNNKSPFITAIFWSYLAISILIYSIHLKISYPVFKTFSVLFMFRNPAKLTALSTFYLTVLFFFFLNFLILKVRTKRKRYIIMILTFAGILMTLWPITTGSRGLFVARNNVTITDSFKKIQTIIASFPDTDPTAHNIWFPQDHELTNIKLAWLDRKKVSNQLGLNQFGDGDFGSTISDIIISSIKNQDRVLLDFLLETYRIQNVVILKQTKQEYWNQYEMKSAVEMKQLFQMLPVAYEDNDVLIYHRSLSHPLIYIPKTIQTVSENTYFSFLTLKNNFHTAFSNDPHMFFQQNSTHEAVIKTQKINPTKYKLTIYNAPSKFPLLFAATFHDGWRIEDENGNRYRPHIINGYANGWIVSSNNQQPIKLTLSFQPQQLFIYSLYSGTGLIIVGISILLWIKRKQSI